MDARLSLSRFNTVELSSCDDRDILERNPNKEEDKYTEEDLQHMRKVVSYCKRHLAQEDKMKDTKSPEELEQTKSTKSLKVCSALASFDQC